MWEMKVQLLLCVCMALVGTQLAGCGDQADSLELEPVAAPENDAEYPAPDAKNDRHDGADTDEPAAPSDCPELDEAPASCGQISIKLKGLGSSCQLMPTASDLSRYPRSVRFDCTPLVRGPNGYDYDATGHLTLMGDTCEALQQGGPHRVTLLLTCEPGTSER
jgi:hypothetical protein